MIEKTNHNYHGCLCYSREFKRRNTPIPLKNQISITNSIIPTRLLYEIGIPINYERIMRFNADLNLFFTYNIPKCHFKSPVISTVHDIILQKVQNESSHIIEAYDKKVKYAISHSDRIITVSEASKKDIIEYYNIDEKKIIVVPSGVDYSSFNNRISDYEKERIRKKYNLPKKFFLYFGGIRKHKNVDSIIRAYALLPKNYKDEFKLVITKGNDELKRLVTNSNETQNVFLQDL